MVSSQRISLEGLGDLLGYSDKDFQEMIQYSELCSRNGKLLLNTLQKPLNTKVAPQVSICSI
jgi:hypothetical protein